MTLFQRVRNIFSPALLPFLLATATCGLPASAAQPNSYDVEIVVFSYRHPADNGEQWPTQEVAGLPSASSYTSAEVLELPVNAYKLNNISNGLRQSSNYSVLFHRAWRQPAYDDTNAVSLPVSAVSDNGRSDLEGKVRLIRERFLHLDTDLRMMQTAGYQNPAPELNVPATPVYAIREKRRIKSNVVHYFDNPRFGMIATVTPYYSPEESQQQPEDTQADDETVENEEAPVNIPQDDNQLTR